MKKKKIEEKVEPLMMTFWEWCKVVFWVSLTIILVICLLFLLAFAASGMFKDDYKITIQECHSKELPCQLIEYHNRSAYVCPQYFVEVNESVISNISVQLPLVCEDKEVDEIRHEEINKRYDAFNDGNAYYLCSDYPYKWNNTDLYLEYCYDIVTQKINKKELTKEWLNENCECIYCPCWTTKYEHSLVGEDCVWKAKQDCNNHCNKYKCGEYEVEVL